MKGWVGAAMASVAIVVALTMDPVVFFGIEATGIKTAFMVVLLSAAGAAFVLGLMTSELNLSRQAALWSASFAIIVITATNLDVLLGTSQSTKAVAKLNAPVEPVVPVSKKRRKPASAVVYIPDTSKLDRVEGLVEPQTSFFTSSKNQQIVKNRISQKNTRLPTDWKISDEQKQKFKKFLAAQGQKYDPATAFNFPGIAPKIAKTTTPTTPPVTR